MNLNLSPSDSTFQLELQQTLRIYGLYRIVLAALILIVFLVQMTTTVENAYRPDLFLYTIGSYFVISVITHFYAGLRAEQLNNLELFVYFFLVDLAALTLIAHASGGLSTGLSLIMSLTVACGGIFFRDRLALLVAAIASIATLLNVSYLIKLGIVPNSSLLAAGLLGTVFFATVFFVQLLARRIEASQKIAEEKARELAYSEYLNQLIVKRMQTGVLVIDGQRVLHSANESARAMLGLNSESLIQQTTLPGSLLNSLNQWQQSPHFRTKPFRVSKAGALLQSEFMPLTDQDEGKVLVFLEDTGRARQQAQQFKLASLGRLTASIAHEIRNPLGAISHAAQLMNESSTITVEDQRLCQIVNDQSRRMNKIIENVLQLSRRRESEPKRFLIDDWLAQFVSTLQHSDRDADIQVNIESNDFTIAFDPSQLDQVLSNLCSNAIRYSLQSTGRGTVIIHCHIELLQGLPVIDVIDQGPGVTPDTIDQLFEPFYTSEQSGTGLGLFIAKELCEANQSRLDYFPTEDGHGCFRITCAHPMKKLLISSAQ